MLGPVGKPEATTKGAETKWLMYFCTDLFRRHEADLDRRGRLLMRCGVALTTIIDVMKASPTRMPRTDYDRVMGALLNLLRFWEEAGLAFKPNVHLFVHVLLRAPWSGNPADHTTFADEGINRTLGALCRVAHRLVWELRVFAHCTKTQDVSSGKRQRK